MSQAINCCSKTMKWDIFKIYSFKFFDDFVLIYPFYALMFADFGMTPAQIGILLGAWSFTAFVLEMPSGVAADKWSRKHILVIAEIIRALGYAVWIFFPTFWGFLLGFVLWGTKSAFTSGTYQALVYDLLKDNGKEHEYAKIVGRGKTFSYIAILAASGGAAFAIPFGYPLVLTLSIVALLIATISILLVSPAKKLESTHEREYFSILKSGLSYVARESTILRLILFIAIIHALGGAIDEYFPIFGDLTNISKSGVAIFIGAMSAAQAFASFFAYKFEKLPLRFFYFSLIISGLLFFWAATALNMSGLMALVIFSGLYSISSIVIESKFQHLIPSATRATISSVQGFFVEIGVLTVYFGFGVLAEVYNFAKGFQIFGLVIIGIGLLYLAHSYFNKATSFDEKTVL